MVILKFTFGKVIVQNQESGNYRDTEKKTRKSKMYLYLSLST